MVLCYAISIKNIHLRIGENEMNENKVTLKNMETGEQTLVSAEELIQTLKK